MRAIAIVLTACGIETVAVVTTPELQLCIAIVLTACGIETDAELLEYRTGISGNIAIVLTACGIETHKYKAMAFVD